MTKYLILTIFHIIFIYFYILSDIKIDYRLLLHYAKNVSTTVIQPFNKEPHIPF